jgi:cellulose biosynthesis protein BcsQ
VSTVLATYNIKGGVGKTSAAVNLAYLAARGGAQTLLWDLDPQGASTYLFRIKSKVRGGGRKLVRLRSEVSMLIKGTDHEGLDLLPADFSYRHMDLALDAFKRPTRRLARVLAPLILAFFSMVDRRKRLHREVMERVRSQWSGMLETAIPASAEIERMGLERDIVASYARRGGAALAYETLWGDVRRRLAEYPSRPA